MAVHLASAQVDKHALMSKLIAVNDSNISLILRQQYLSDGHHHDGVILDADSVISPIGTAQFIQTLMCGYVSKQSAHHQSNELLSRMTRAAQALVNLQHDDGTIDLLTTNFHSTPDLGFTIFPLATSYTIMQKNADLQYGELGSLAKRYLVKGGQALSVGGIHTPNHRWVVCAGLAWINSLFPDRKYEARVDQWLAEKIDIDPDGQYNERSTAVYTPITNRSLIDVARKMGKEELYEPVRKNLDLTFHLVHANGEIATESSNRQDKYLRRNMAGYFLAYNHMAIRDRDSRYAGMVEYILETVPASHLTYMLPLFLEDPFSLSELPEGIEIPTSYHRHFKHSDMVRIREGEVDMSIISNNTTFLTFFKGQAALEAVRLSAAFFGKGQFQSATLEKKGGEYILRSSLEGPYYQPLSPKQIPAHTDAWTAVPRTQRKQSEVQKMETTISIRPGNKRVMVRIKVDGPENLPVALELGFREGGELSNVDVKKGIDDAWLSRNGQAIEYRYQGDTIRVSPGVRAHSWTQLRGALPKLEAQSVYVTAYAPCEFEFTIE